MTPDGFDLWLGHVAQERPFRHEVHKALSVAGGWRGGFGNRGHQFIGSRIARGFAIGRVLSTSDRHLGPRSRRVVVKVRIVRLRGSGTASAAHLRYLQRDGTTRDGERGTLYSAVGDDPDSREFLERGSEDRHEFRIVVSPEDGAEYDELKPMVRRLMSQAETDLETKLDWVGIDHFNTGHPHSHIVVCGKDDRGENLIIAPDYVYTGLRVRATDLVNLDLGPRNDLEIMRANLREVEQERLTGIDQRLLRAIAADGIVTSVGGDSIEQSLRAGRLAMLGRMGLAVEERKGRWRLSEKLEPTLRAMGKRRESFIRFDREQAGDPTEGTDRRSAHVGVTRLALIDNSPEYSLVPWQPTRERQIGKELFGNIRGTDVSLTFGGQRSGPAI
jgi:type IV secretory pathway VirD2 relaxase